LLPVLSLLIFGGETLKDFAVALLIGTASGTYSSIFIAGPVLTHWKERDPIYRQRAARIKATFGYVPAYATTVDGKAIDVEPEGKRRRTGGITAPQDPTQVSREEFDEMVQDISHETQPEPKRSRSATAERPTRAPKPEPAPEPEPEPEATAPEPSADVEPEAETPPPAPGSGADLTPDEVVMPKQKSQQRPRNRRPRGGRPR
jgi:SecD/SecF fusion protein